MLVLGLVTWPEYARMVRAKTLALRGNPLSKRPVPPVPVICGSCFFTSCPTASGQ